ncbi:MAG: hypothetical protein WCL23_02885 [Candidatus Moraniibacteriota bacterium]
MMNGNMELPGNGSEERRRSVLKDMHRFISENDMTPDDVEAATSVFLGDVDSDRGREAEDPIMHLAVMMHDAEKNGLPINDITLILSDRLILEGAPDRFGEFVGTLVVSEREKELLRSILERGRVGKISFIDKNGKILAELTVPADLKMSGRVHRAEWLLQSIRKYVRTFFGTPYEIIFEED